MRGKSVRTLATLLLMVCLVTAPVANVTAVSGTPQSSSLDLAQSASEDEGVVSDAGSQPVAVAAPEPAFSVDAPREATVGESV